MTIQTRRRRGSEWCHRSWARLVGLLVRMIATARQQMVIDDVIRTVAPPTSTASSSTSAPTSCKQSRNQQPVRQGLGAPMSRSQVKNTWTERPESCPHGEEDLRMRGNQAQFWWVCLRCGSRWERTLVETVPSTKAPATAERRTHHVTEPPKPSALEAEPGIFEPRAGSKAYPDGVPATSRTMPTPKNPPMPRSPWRDNVKEKMEQRYERRST